MELESPTVSTDTLAEGRRTRLGRPHDYWEYCRRPLVAKYEGTTDVENTLDVRVGQTICWDNSLQMLDSGWLWDCVFEPLEDQGCMNSDQRDARSGDGMSLRLSTHFIGIENIEVVGGQTKVKTVSHSEGFM